MVSRKENRLNMSFDIGNIRDSEGLKQGFWRSYYLNGNLQSEGHYVDDKRHGLWKSWHTNGKQWDEAYYVDNKIDGAWKGWDSDGRLRFSYYALLDTINILQMFEGEQINYEY